MKSIFFTFFLSLISSFGICQNDPCESYKKTNSQLVKEKSQIQKELDYERIASDRLEQKLAAEQEARQYWQNLYYEERRQNEILRQKLQDLNEEYLNIISERDNLKSEADRLSRELGESNSRVQELRIEVDKKTEESKKSTQSAKRANEEFDDRQKAVDAYRDKIKKLEDEAKDRVSVSEKKVYFKGVWYNYGQEILFVKYTEKSSSEQIISEQDRYLLERLAKLVSKYDMRVKIELIGESNMEEKDLRIQLAKNRPLDLKEFLITNYSLIQDNFSSTDYLKEKARIGVAVYIKKK